MMRPSHVATYTGRISDVNSDFLLRLRRVRNEDLSISNMDKELFDWALESEFVFTQTQLNKHTFTVRSHR